MKDFEREITNYYGKDLEQKKQWYSEVADAYNRTRPPYPKQLIDRALSLAQIPSDSIILELGCGPGTATTAFAKLGFKMICLEPSEEACQLARQNCAQYPDVNIINTTFEEWQLETKRFNAVLAATSFHWISPDIRYAKVADALKDDGSLILLCNTPPQPSYEVYQMLDEVYHIHAPSIRYEDINTHKDNLRKLEQNTIESGKFKDFVSEDLVTEVTYSIDDYLALLSTLSPYIALETQQRDSLFEGLREILESNCGKNMDLSFLSVFQIAKKNN